MAMQSPVLDPQEAVKRAQFLMNRHGKFSMTEYIRFCQGRMTPELARQVFRQLNYDEIAPGEYAQTYTNAVNMPLASFSGGLAGHPRNQGQLTAIANQQQAAHAQNQQNLVNQIMQQMIPQSIPGFLSGSAGKRMIGLQTFVDDDSDKKKAKKKEKSPFKKGDRVELLKTLGEFGEGTMGTIEMSDDGAARVVFDGYEGEASYIEWKLLKKYIKPKITIDSVVLSADKKEEIRAAIAQVENAKTIFEKWGFASVFEKGTAISLLFWGIPGTGKTLMAQAIADENEAELKIYSTADIESQEPGGAERMIRMIFQEAIKKNRAGHKRVLLFDECDSLLMDRNEVGPILGAQVNALLTEIEHYDGIVIFTTNRLGKLDAALERRLSAKIEFPFPDQAQRLAIWKRMIPKQAPIHESVDFDKLAEHEIAGGAIKNAVLNAARSAAYRKDTKLTMEHFQNAVTRERDSASSFVNEYKKNTHPTMHGYSKGYGTGLSINKEKDMTKQISVSKTLSEQTNENEN